MRMRNPKYMNEVIESCPFLIKDEINFENDYPIHIEIGMGKGNFIINMARKYHHINFIGIEKYSSVASIAIKKIMELEEGLPNLKIIISDIKNLEELLKEKVEVIYLNFSDPWPKKKHAKRRLTSPEFLALYDKLFKGENKIFMKTDNDDLFAYSLDSLKEYGYEFKKISYDLESEDTQNVLTEYEEKFRNQGIKIKYFEAIK